MNKLVLPLTLCLSACGGPAAPEVYNLVIDAFSVPSTCYANGVAPTTTVNAAPSTLMQAEAWDGPNGEAFLEITAGSITYDMGAAPAVTAGGVLSGTRGSKGWTFVSQRSSTGTTANTSSTTQTQFSLTFERAVTFKGTGTATSSRECTGTGCPATNPSCTLDPINVHGTRIDVTYQKSP